MNNPNVYPQYQQNQQFPQYQHPEQNNLMSFINKYKIIIIIIISIIILLICYNLYLQYKTDQAAIDTQRVAINAQRDVAYSRLL